MEKQDINKLVDSTRLISAFNSDYVSEMKKLLRKIATKLTGKTMSTSSGGNFCHIFFQLDDFNWVGFHNGDGSDFHPSITTKTFKTAKSLETGFFNDNNETNVVYGMDLFPDKITNAEFLNAKKVIEQWCKEKNRDISFLYPRGK